jgi:hypothetical protein
LNSSQDTTNTGY